MNKCYLETIVVKHIVSAAALKAYLLNESSSLSTQV